MFRNQLHPITIFSSLILSVSVLSLSISGQFFHDRFRYSDGESILSFSSWSTSDLIGFFTFLGIGAFLMTGALGLLFYKKWARYLMQIGFILAAMAWLMFMSENRNSFSSVPVLFTGITAAILGSVIGALLFLNNSQWVLPHFRDYAAEEGSGQVLDRDFWDKK